MRNASVTLLTNETRKNIALQDRQLKVSIERNLAETFKASCAARGVSMASEISRLIRDTLCASLPSPAMLPYETRTRRHRRKATAEIVRHLWAIACAEEDYRENIPENLKGGAAYDAATTATSALEEAISLLYDAFS
jgi:hypothetical protein